MISHTDRGALQQVICIKDNNHYVYKIDENPYFIEEDYTLIMCFPVKAGEEQDFSGGIEIYGKDLVSADESGKICFVSRESFW